MERDWEREDLGSLDLKRMAVGRTTKKRDHPWKQEDKKDLKRREPGPGPAQRKNCISGTFR